MKCTNGSRYYGMQKVHEIEDSGFGMRQCHFLSPRVVRTAPTSEVSFESRHGCKNRFDVYEASLKFFKR